MQEISYPLLVEVLRSLNHVSNFFTDRHHFEWMLESTVALSKQAQTEDPPNFESALVTCMLKSAAFASVVTSRDITSQSITLMEPFWLTNRRMGTLGNW